MRPKDFGRTPGPCRKLLLLYDKGNFVIPFNKGITKQKISSIIYPDIQSTLRPVPFGEELPLPVHRAYFLLISDKKDEAQPDI